MKKELDEAEKLKVESKNLLSDYENKIDKSKKETQEIVRLAKKISEKEVLEKTHKFHQMMGSRKKNVEQNSFDENTIDSFEFNQDMAFEEEIRSPGWLRLIKKNKK